MARCSCGVAEGNPENATYVVDGKVACTKECWKLAIKRYLQQQDRVTHVTPGDFLPEYAWDVVT
jgi:hypothetical protein